VAWLVGAWGTLGAERNLLLNGGFEEGRSDWQLPAGAAIDREIARHGQASLRLREGSVRQELRGLASGGTFTCAVAIKVADVKKSAEAGYAFIAIYQLDDFDEVISARDFAQPAGTADWAVSSHSFTVAEGCRTVSVRGGLFQATGSAWFDDFTLQAGAQALPFERWAAQEQTALQSLGFKASLLGNVAIFKDDIPAAGAPASPDELGAMLRGAGLGVAFLNHDQLSAPTFLNRGTFDVVVLPYGASFPVNAADNFRRFLRQGGKFFSTGGYAFDNLLEHTPGGWKAPQAGAEADWGHAIWRYEIPAAALRGHSNLTFSGWLKAAHITGPGMAYFAVYQTAADGSLPDWRDICQVRGSQAWKEYQYTFAVHPRAAVVDLRLGLFRCGGVAAFDDVKLTDAAGNVLVDADFEQEFDPEGQGAQRWLRSSSSACQVQTRTRHSGRRAVKVTLPPGPGPAERLNTRHGLPEDGLLVEPTQLGVFQADFLLERVQRARWALVEGSDGTDGTDGTDGADKDTRVKSGVKLEGQWEGFAAAGVVGFEQARWVPLVNTYDGYGRPRGAAGALLRHFAGIYAGSSWAFFGVTNVNLFSAASPAAAEAFVSIIRSLVEDTYFAALVPDRGCYRQGEPVGLLATLFNGSAKEHTVKLEVDIYEGPPIERERRQPVATLAAAAILARGQTNLVFLKWQPQRFGTNFYHLRGRLYHADREVDRIESGLVVWDERAVAGGPKLNFRDNYLRLGRRPMFLFGTDDWGYVFNTSRETPLQWWRDMRQRRDFGVQIYENLQFGLPASADQREQLLRKVDGIVQLAQQYQQVYLAGLLIGFNTAAGDAELVRQTDYCRDFARRYAAVPGLIYYLNGDLACKLGDWVTPQWNQFLRERYGSTEAVRAAWGGQGPVPELGHFPAEDFYDWGHPWEDVKIYDLNHFRAWLIRRWSSALVAGIHEADRAHPTTAEFYQLPHQGVDIHAAIDGIDLANFGFCEKPGQDLQRFPALCKYNDKRALGKSTGPGEYGVKTHPAWGDGKDYMYHTARTRAQAVELFLGVAQYSLGLGASRLHNWCWKDDAHRVFPWGMVYPCDGVPKDTAYVHRNQSLLFRQFAPVYREPAVYVLMPDCHRLGGGKWEVQEGILRSLDLLLATHADNPGTLTEQFPAIPAPAKVIFYPLPFCPPDGVCAALLAWVRQGGVLYVSGDLSFDELRRRTRTGRLEELCGVRFVRENYKNISAKPDRAADQPCIQVEPAGAEVLARTTDGAPLLLEHRLGHGRVFFTTDPLELHSIPQRRARDLELYRRVLRAGRLQPLGLQPDDPLIHLFRVPLEDGGKVYVLFNTDPSQPDRTVTVSDCRPPLRLTVARNRPALAWFDGRGALRAVEALQASIADAVIFKDGTRGMACALDGKDLRQSQALLLMPLQPGEILLAFTKEPRTAVLEIGDMIDGSWRTFAQTPASQDQERWSVTVRPGQEFCLLLVCPKAEAARWRQAVERGFTDPETLE
jgi:hypothetical protein